MAEIDWRQMQREDAIAYLTEDLGIPDRDAGQMWAIATGVVDGDALNLQGKDPLKGKQLDTTNRTVPDNALPANATPEQLNKAMPTLLRSLLTSGAKGYKDTIDRLDPEPSQANNWCFNNDTEQYQGALLNGDKRITYNIKQERGQWVVTTALEGNEFAEPISATGDDSLLADSEWDALAAGVSEPDVIEAAMDAIAQLDQET